MDNKEYLYDTLSIKEEVIPYIIAWAYPDYKRPSIIHNYGMIEQNKLKEFIINDILSFLDGRIDYIDTMDDLRDYLSYRFYEDYDLYMDNPPWEGSIVINGQWLNIDIPYEEIFAAILEQKRRDKEYDKEEYDKEENMKKK